jgi:hypothetical protein
MANVDLEVAGYLRRLIDIGASSSNETGVARETYSQAVTVVDSSGNVIATFGGAAKAGTGTQSSVAGSASSVTILAANANRLSYGVFNDSTAILYILNAAGTASTSVFSAQVFPNSYYEPPANVDYTGIVKGIWASATGSGRVTEFSA